MILNINYTHFVQFVNKVGGLGRARQGAQRATNTCTELQIVDNL
jgi:hypothetical protein